MDIQNHHAANPCIFIFDSVRLRSNLFFRYLTTASQTQPIWHPFVPASMFGPEYVAQHFRHAAPRQEELDEQKRTIFGDYTFAGGREEFSKAVAEAQAAGKVPVSNEHWLQLLHVKYILGLGRGEIQEPAQLGRNPTQLPDEVFDTLQPIILIRHPAISINSIYRDSLVITNIRTGDEDLDIMSANRPLRILFDYFKAQNRQPVVVDAEDLLWRTEDVTKNLCAALGRIEASDLSDTWEPKSEEEIANMNLFLYKTTQNIVHSTGIQRPSKKPAEPSIEKTVQQWKELYGDDVAEYLKRLVDENMPHYEYLSQFKV